ncbi:MAG: erythromycin esterase family protein [Pseudomonadota bacterium]
MSKSVIKTLQQQKTEFSSMEDLQPLLDALKDKKVVMLGEASHGTHEYYHWRAEISKKLLQDYDFDFVAVEGDWPPCYELNRHVKHYDDAIKDLNKVMQEFQRWPAWMWANHEVRDWTQWLASLNHGLPEDERKGFYGLDVYSLWESLDAVMDYLKDEDPQSFEVAKTAMRCFEPHRDKGGQRYALSTRLVPAGCSVEVAELLKKVLSRTDHYDGDREHPLSIEQNAMVSHNAEQYYRIMMSGDESTWNLRDQHMMDTLKRLMAFHGPDAKGIIWAHNTHIGDASYTDMGDAGMYNIGELGRQEYGRDKVALIGLGGYRGQVLAGTSWGSPVQEMELPAARLNSWEDWCHEAGIQFYVACSDLIDVPELQQRIGHRAVGVVYDPQRERLGNYAPSIVPQRYDYFIFFEETRALNSLNVHEQGARIPDTYPYGT